MNALPFSTVSQSFPVAHLNPHRGGLRYIEIISSRNSCASMNAIVLSVLKSILDVFSFWIDVFSFWIDTFENDLLIL